MAKNANWQLETATVNCPHEGCDGFLHGSNGSVLMTATEIAKLPATIKCPTCRKDFKIPSLLRNAVEYAR